MANRTVKEAKNVHGTNPQYLIEKIIRSRIYDSKYWKEKCFALTAELLVDKAMEIRFIGGVYGGNIKPTEFLCLTLKMLQIQPEKDIVVEFIKNDEFKYVRALGAFYLRLTGTSVDCYKYLEPLYNDNRKLRRQNRSGQFELVYMDDFIDELLRSDRVCDIILPRIQKRDVLEENNELEPKVSALDDDLDNVEQILKMKIKPTAAECLKKKARRDVERAKSRSREREDKKREAERQREMKEREKERAIREKEREKEVERRRKDREERRRKERELEEKQDRHKRDRRDRDREDRGRDRDRDDRYRRDRSRDRSRERDDKRRR
uniref:Pre-mRNA-splicing factor 38 n=1 Tax=Megaselia scalaris TaxID=36166 RepID=T1H306_MEGSC